MAAFLTLHGVGKQKQPFKKIEIPVGRGEGYQNTPWNGNSKGGGCHRKNRHGGMDIFWNYIIAEMIFGFPVES